MTHLPVPVKPIDLPVINKLKEAYDQKSFEELEKGAFTARKKSIENLIVYFGYLFYFESTRRFREHPRYKKSSFGEYLLNEHHINESNYINSRIAIIKHPIEVKRLGLPTVIQIRKKCGAINADKVFGELNSKNREPTQSEINNSIGKHIDPVKVKSASPDFISASRQWEEKFFKLQEEYQALSNQYIEALGQINKLKQTVKQARE